jgi:hypothetical protein
MWDIRRAEHAEVIGLITGFDQPLFEREIVLIIQNGRKRINKNQMAKHDRELDRFYFACILQQLIAETSPDEIVQMYKVTQRSVQSLQMQTAIFTDQSV